MNYKDRMIDTAITILADMFQINEKYLREVSVRTKPVIEARRLLIFYMNRFIGIKHVDMKKYMKGVCHATSIHHCNKMEWFLVNTKGGNMESKKQYDDFQERMSEFDVTNEMIKDKQLKIVQLQAEVNEYLYNNKND